MHSLNFDHGFSSACPSGNHMMEDRIWANSERADRDLCDDGEEHAYIDGTCRKCGKSQ